MEEVGYAKLVRFCLYRERCISEVMEKLRSTELPEKDFAKIIRKLQMDGYLDEQRFARAFAQDKFRLKKWGRRKIQYELQGRRVAASLIQEAIYAIDDEEYRQTMEELRQRKEKELVKDKDPRVRKARLIKFLVGKGYEYDLVADLLKEKK